MKKLRVAVLAGGKSAEHQVSIATASEVLSHLNHQKYEAFPVYISKDGFSWQILESGQFFALQTSLESNKSEEKNQNLSVEKEAHNGVEEIKKTGVDIAFIALHGPFGEDGTVQGFLELVGIPYTGSGVLASALGMDKIASRRLFSHAGLTVPKSLSLKKGEKTDHVWRFFQPPVVVKPSNQGSSIGVTIVRKKDHLTKSLGIAFSFSHLAIVEEYLDGIEVTCAVLGSDNPQTLPLVEIRPKNEFFDFEAKYNETKCEEIVPAQIPENVAKKAQKAALAAFKSLGCRVFARVDMIIKDSKPYVLEVNTIPGLTSVSLLPKAAVAAGISYSDLLDKIITFSLSN